ncbi:hypothetical protein [Polaromonas sp. CG_9.11]|uniref:hypothetical protein n=1 Tax=Polaromonas sp. CG_9.11 TaxID=2787730 RepID=UPI0018CB08DE|nr:hypothetical protein [Polaromonas sp. CG_9.11]MBG6075749.1 hypothetical protein [Polaromonas sp. CG_9.11]
MRRTSAALVIGYVILAAAASPAYAKGAGDDTIGSTPAKAATVKNLPAPKDPTKETVLIGRTITDGLTWQLALEGAEAMWMPMGKPAIWSEHKPAQNERDCITVKATDNATKTRIPSAWPRSLQQTKTTGKP